MGRPVGAAFPWPFVLHAALFSPFQNRLPGAPMGRSRDNGTGERQNEMLGENKTR
jgi:hypothetical protein